MANVVFDPGWQQHLDAPKAELLERLGTEITTDAKAAAPVRTGKLRDSIDYEVRGDTVQISAGVDYAIYVEEGTRYMHAEPFLRPALYKARGL